MKKSLFFLISLSSLLFAEGAAPAAMGGMDGTSNIIMLVVMVIVFWFILIRRESKRQKEAVNMRDSLKKGDKVITRGGIYGTIKSVQDEKVVLTVSKTAEMTVIKTHIDAMEADLNKELGK